MTDALFESYSQTLSVFPQSVIERVSGLFVSEDICPGPGTSDLLSFFRALVEEKASEIFYLESLHALSDGTLPQLFSETLDRGLLAEISKDLVSSSLSEGIWNYTQSDSAIFIFESQQYLQSLGLEHGMQAFWFLQAEESQVEL